MANHSNFSFPQLTPASGNHCFVYVQNFLFFPGLMGAFVASKPLFWWYSEHKGSDVSFTYCFLYFWLCNQGFRRLDCVVVIILMFLRNLCVLFRNGCTNSYSHKSVPGPIFLHVLRNSLLFHDIWKIASWAGVSCDISPSLSFALHWRSVMASPYSWVFFRYLGLLPSFIT